MVHWNESPLEGRPDQKLIPCESSSGHTLLLSRRRWGRTTATICKALCPAYSPEVSFDQLCTNGVTTFNGNYIFSHLSFTAIQYFVINACWIKNCKCRLFYLHRSFHCKYTNGKIHFYIYRPVLHDHYAEISCNKLIVRISCFKHVLYRALKY